MPSSLNLFIRIPKGVSEHEVRDAVIRKDICSVIGVVIKKGKSNNNAIVMVDFWYKGTRHIRDALIRGESISIASRHTNWLAYEYNSNKPSKVVIRSPSQDEFGRDISKKSKKQVAQKLSANAPAFVPIAPKLLRFASEVCVGGNVGSSSHPLKIAPALPIAPVLSNILPPFITDTRAERHRNRNNYAAEEFIKQYECYETPAKMPVDAIAPGAPLKRSGDGEIFEQDLSEVICQLDSVFGETPIESDSISDVTDDFAEERRERKPRFITIDVDAPKQGVLEVNYSNVNPIKKRNIRIIKK
jgi:hypothetical protein